MPITKFRFTNAGPFDDVAFEFDPQVNVLVGPNNSGKSTALVVLAEATVYPFDFPRKVLKGTDSKWEMTLSNDHRSQRFAGKLPADLRQQPAEVGPLPHIGYSTFVPSLRRSTDYRSEGPSIHSGEQMQIDFLEDPHGGSGINSPELRKRRALISTNSALVSDELVIRKMVELDYSAYRRNRPQIRQVIEKVASIASEVTEGYPIQFLGVREDDRGLFPEFSTPDGDLPLNVLSQGTQSIIQWLCHFLFGYAQYYDYPDTLEKQPGMLIVDEIDAHLHPSWQRRVIPALTGNFPNLQIFCSTHSPLTLAGPKEGQVQLLNRDKAGKVTVSRNQSDIIGWSADEVVVHLLGVRNATDLTTSIDVDRLGQLSNREILSENESAELEDLRNRVHKELSSGPPAAQVEFLLQQIKRLYSGSGPDSDSLGKPRPSVRRRNNGSP